MQCVQSEKLRVLPIYDPQFAHTIFLNILHNILHITHKKEQRLNRHFTKKDMSTTNKNIPTLLVFRETEVKTTMRHHYTPVRKAKIKKQ